MGVLGFSHDDEEALVAAKSPSSYYDSLCGHGVLCL